MIDHFVRAHLHMYNQALSEIKNGKKYHIGFGTYFHNYQDQVRVVCLRLMRLKIENMQPNI